ncbi:MAG: Omp28-related outer membrane protein [Bacteroidetes bacterium]|nr:Omp28-related outer membrane protein [Bacteroidota bacterium]
MKTKAIFTCLFILSSLLCYSQHSRNIIVYNTTSTDCGPCSCLDSIFNIVVQDSFPNTIIVEFHEIGSNPDFNTYRGDDVVHTFRHTPELDPSCFPNGFGYDVNYLSLINKLNGLYNEFPETPIDLKITSKIWNPDSLSVDLVLNFKNDGLTLNGDYWYNVIVTEDKLIRDHRTLDSCSTPNRPHVPIDSTFVNNAVTRMMVYYSEGTSLTESTWDANQEFTASCNFKLDPSWISDNCNVVVNVYEKADSLYKAPVLQAIKEAIISPSSVPEQDISKEGILKVYPNPSSDFINVHFSVLNRSLCSINIYNLEGKKVKSLVQGYMNPGLYNYEINLSDFPSGEYLVILETSKGKSWKKLVIL